MRLLLRSPRQLLKPHRLNLLDLQG
jgi:hypothetical protein